MKNNKFASKALIAAIFSIFIAISLSQSAKADVGMEALIKAEIATRILMKDSGLSKDGTLHLVSQNVMTESGLDFVEQTLTQEKVGQVKILLRGPHGFMDDKKNSYRCLFMASGFFTGKDGVKLLSPIANTVLVGYEYPYQLQDAQKDPKVIYKFLRQTPLQIASALQWLTQSYSTFEQGWMDNDGLYVIGVSLGGLFLPSSLDIASRLNVPIQGTIFAYTGADLAPVVVKAIHDQVPSDVAKVAGQAVAGLTALHDPRIHLPFLQGKFLVIRATEDQVFPIESGMLLEQLLPQPKTVRLVPGGHINTDQPDTIKMVQKIVSDWIVGN